MQQYFKKGSILGVILFILLHINSFAQTQFKNIPEGSYFINLGTQPQTFNNALKPYGLVYALLDRYPLNIKWIINPDKKKDGVDFILDGVEYKTGSFVIPVSYLSDEVKETIQKWERRGVVGAYSSENIQLPIFTNLSIAPRWTLDKRNGIIALPYFSAAGMPAKAYGGNNPIKWKDPLELGICDDIFVMPHAEPKFSSHKNLYSWNKDFMGSIWASCHAVSIMENLKGFEEIDGKPAGEFIQMNFLSAGFPGATTSGLIPFFKHRNATPPFDHLLPADPVAQFLGNSDKAYLNGSERVFFPKQKNMWRKESKILILDPDAPDIPSRSRGEAAIALYGHGFGDKHRGLVMYQASHSIYGKKPENVAAIRAFFNWSFYATELKREKNLINFKSLDAKKEIVAARVGDDLTSVLKLKPITFNLDSYDLKPVAMLQLDSIVNFMKKYPFLLLDIRSHTDSRADDDYNLKLSENRVIATSNYIIANGVSKSRISGRGYGETDLVNDCRNRMPCNEAEHEMNRRSEFILSIDCEIYSSN